MPSDPEPPPPTLLDDEALDGIPIFPLPNVVLFPDVVLPLHIFEPRYRAMLADCLATKRALVIAHVDVAGSGRMAEIAGAGVIVDHQPLPDGRSNIAVVGVTRVRLDEILHEQPPRFPYKRARATRLASTTAHVGESDRAGLLAAATMFATEVKRHDPSFAFRFPARRPEGSAEVDAGAVADTCAFQLVVDANVRQAALEELDPRARVRIVMNQLALQHGAMLGEPSEQTAGRGRWGGAPS